MGCERLLVGVEYRNVDEPDRVLAHIAGLRHGALEFDELRLWAIVPLGKLALDIIAADRRVLVGTGRDLVTGERAIAHGAHSPLVHANVVGGAVVDRSIVERFHNIHL